jgi:protein O-GlcNAc transferase
MNDLRQTEAALRQATERSPGQAGPWTALGAALMAQSKWEEAADAFRQALVIEPNDADTWSCLGAAHWAIGRLREADEAYARSLAISHSSLPILRNYGRLLTECQQPQRALKVLEEVLNRDPTHVASWLLAGDVLELVAEFAQAIAAYQRAMSLEPSNHVARHRLALLLIHHGSLVEAAQLVQQIVCGEPQSPEAWALLAALQQKQVLDAEAAVALRRALALKPNVDYHSNLLQILQCAEDVSPEGLLLAHRQWNAAYAAALYPNPPPAPIRSRASQLRLGFVSADFGRHPTGYLGLRPIECLDKTHCSVVGYYDRLLDDDFTDRFRAAADQWRITSGWSAEKLAHQIRIDDIDILFDLTAHTGHRLLTFARKPAPVQITWLGYVGTTGMTAIDYLLADRFHIRPREEEYYVERILRMPNGYACYGPPAGTPDVATLPAQATGRVTFGCFNNPAKLSGRILDAWAEILKRLPQAQLLLKNRGLNQPNLRDRIHVHFAQHRIPPQRIVLEGGSPHRELLASYHRVDLALDTQPYSGGLTTCEALWMGVPVITFPGTTFAGRHSVSHMTNAGLGQFVARDLAGYIELAVNWANRLEELAILRAQMRDLVRRSPLCDAPQFARDLLAMLRQAWETHG